AADRNAELARSATAEPAAQAALAAAILDVVTLTTTLPEHGSSSMVLRGPPPRPNVSTIIRTKPASHDSFSTEGRRTRPLTRPPLRSGDLSPRGRRWPRSGRMRGSALKRLLLLRPGALAV